MSISDFIEILCMGIPVGCCLGVAALVVRKAWAVIYSFSEVDLSKTE